MAYVPKRLNVLSAMAKVEATYNVDPVPAAATDGVLLQIDASTANLMPDVWSYSGDNGPNSVGLEANPWSAPTGRSCTASMPMFFRGAGAAYSASVVPPNGWHVLIKGCGYTATGSFGAGVEKFTYTPTADSVTPTSNTIYLNGRQVLSASNMVLQKMNGGLGTMKVNAGDPKPALFSFDYKGVSGGDPAETAFTLPTLVNTPVVPNSAGLTFTIDGTALRVYSWSFDEGRDLGTERVALTTAAAHFGFVGGPWKPIIKFTVEDELFATYNGYTKLASKAGASVILGWNQTVQYNRIKLLAPQAQIMTVTPSGKGRSGLVDIQCLCVPTTPSATDSHSWVAD